jgi:para-aminobenzoate synthetase / 4-amino-4-deoxychorismate lyase
MQRIGELEPHARGLYTGSLGWVAPGGDCRFNVAIRTIEVDDRGEARLGIGGGIVIDARPESEYAECLLKARFISGFDPGFELIETMRLENGSIALLELHLQRLAASARTLGFACELLAVRCALETIVAAHPQGVHRVRLTLAHCGQYGLEAAPLPDPPVTWSVVLSDKPLGSASYLLRHKTTVRSLYDRALAGLSARPDVFDVLFLNERGEVCEGARSNVFIERGGRLLTPPLSCGLLPGVMRRYLLDSGRAVEQILTRDDLLCAHALYVANALRGLLPVHLKR